MPSDPHRFPMHALVLDGSGGGRALTADELASKGTPRPHWIHLDVTDDRSRDWLERASGLDEVAIEALLAEETRPRCTPHDSGVLITLRGVNLNPGADPEDMVSIRIWLEKDRIITARVRRLNAVHEMAEALSHRKGPRTAPGVAVFLVERLVERMWSLIGEMDEDVDQMEERLLDADPPVEDLRRNLGQARRQAVVLRRFLWPQREALSRMQGIDLGLFTKVQLTRLREASEGVMRIIEDLDEVRERAVLVRDELTGMADEQMNRTIYLLTLITAVLLPLTFVTGLLGINVGGIPGSEHPAAFWLVVAVLTGVAVLEVWLLRRLRLM